MFHSDLLFVFFNGCNSVKNQENCEQNNLKVAAALLLMSNQGSLTSCNSLFGKLDHFNIFWQNLVFGSRF
jgi:hypothetical protein